MKRVLVAGGAGFIGSHLCERLLTEGHQVLCLDDFSTGQRRNISRLKSLFEPAQFTVFDQCVTATPDRYLALDSGFKIGIEGGLELDEIYNLASPASPPAYQADPIATIHTNYAGTKRLLEVARCTGAKLLQASTSEVYGDPLEHPQKESYWGNVNPNGIRACYDEGKRIAETLLCEYNRQYNVKVQVARIFNTYGPQMRIDDGRVVTNFIAQGLGGIPMTLFGDGLQTRSLCYIDDLLEGLIALMALPQENGFVGPVNLGNPNECTVAQLAAEISAALGIDHRVVYQALPKDDPTRRQPDITKAKKLLGWQPQVTRQEGLMQTIRYFSAFDADAKKSAQ